MSRRRVAVSGGKCYPSGMSTQPPQPRQVVLFTEDHPDIIRQAVSGIFKYVNKFEPFIVSTRDIHDETPLPKNCCGLLAFTPDKPFAKKLLRCKLPTVTVNFAQLDSDVPKAARKLNSIQCDSGDIGMKAAEFFLARKPRTFVYIGLAGNQVWDRERAKAFARRIREAGHEAHLYSNAGHPLPQAQESVRLQEYLKSLPKPLAIFAANDKRAHDVLNACRNVGIAVPHEAVILGADNDKHICESMRPRLSSIPFRTEECGFEAAKMLDALIRHHLNPKSDIPPPETLKMPPGEVVERESTDDRLITDSIASRALSFIRFHKGLNIRATDVANELGVTTTWVERRFRKAQGISLMDEITRTRLKTVLQLIRETDTPFKEISRLCGFATPTTLCHLVKKATGKSMRELRNGNR